MANSSIIDEIKEAIENIDYGSVEIIVQNREVTQISTRIIKKTNVKPAPLNNVKKSVRTGVNINFKY